MVAFLQFVSASTAALFASSHVVEPTPTDMVYALVKRQNAVPDINDIPAQCRPACQGLHDVAASCSTAACACKDSTVASAAECLSCGVSIPNSGVNIQTAQSLVDQLASECNAVGFPVKPASVIVTKNNAISGKRNAEIMGIFLALSLGVILALT